MASKDFFIRQLNKLPADRRLEVHTAVAKICCPFHGNGKERTPSLVINIEPNGHYRPGSWWCFACSEKVGLWDELAKQFKLSKLSNNTEYDVQITTETRTNLLGNAKSLDEWTVGSKLDPMIEMMPLWQKKNKWRDIDGKLLHQLGGRLIPTQYNTSQLYLPVYVNKIFYGGVKCRLKKIEGRPSYFNDDGSWIKKVVYPYDHTKALLAKQKRRVLFFGEGPRDGLNPLQYDIPTVVNLGGKTVWSKAKAQLLIDLEPDLLIVATDPDEIGNETAQLVKSAMKHHCELKRMKFPVKKNGEKSDPGNTSKKRWLELKDKLGII